MQLPRPHPKFNREVRMTSLRTTFVQLLQLCTHTGRAMLRLHWHAPLSRSCGRKASQVLFMVSSPLRAQALSPGSQCT